MENRKDMMSEELIKKDYKKNNYQNCNKKLIREFNVMIF